MLDQGCPCAHQPERLAGGMEQSVWYAEAHPCHALPSMSPRLLTDCHFPAPNRQNISAVPGLTTGWRPTVTAVILQGGDGCPWRRATFNRGGRRQALPSQTRCVRFSRPSIRSMMLLFSCSFCRFSNCQRLSMRRMSETARAPDVTGACSRGAPQLPALPRVPRGGAAECETTSTQGRWEGPKRSGVAGACLLSRAFSGQETHSHCPRGRAGALKETGLPWNTDYKQRPAWGEGHSTGFTLEGIG